MITFFLLQKFNCTPGEGAENNGKDKKITIEKVPESPPATPPSVLSVSLPCVRVGEMSLFHFSLAQLLLASPVEESDALNRILALGCSRWFSYHMALTHKPTPSSVVQLKKSQLFQSWEELAELDSAARCCGGLHLGTNLKESGN